MIINTQFDVGERVVIDEIETVGLVDQIMIQGVAKTYLVRYSVTYWDDKKEPKCVSCFANELSKKPEE